MQGSVAAAARRSCAGPEPPPPADAFPRRRTRRAARRRLYRAPRTVDSAPGAGDRSGEREWLNFAAMIISASAADAPHRGGAGHGSRRAGLRQWRGASGLQAFGRACGAGGGTFAVFTGRPRALLFSTGYLANLGVLGALAGRGDSVLEDRLNHASLLDGGRLSSARLSPLRARRRGGAQAKLAVAGTSASSSRRRVQHGWRCRAAAGARRCHRAAGMRPGWWSMMRTASARSGRRGVAVWRCTGWMPRRCRS